CGTSGPTRARSCARWPRRSGSSWRTRRADDTAAGDLPRVIREALATRRAHVALFQRGDYAPLDVSGGLADHVRAFARVASDDAAIVVVPRFLARRGVETPPLGSSYWKDTRVATGANLSGRFTNVFTDATVSVNDGRLPVAEALADFPVALLSRTA